jgi:hypothetical protein
LYFVITISLQLKRKYEGALMPALPPTAPGRGLPPFFKHLLCQSAHAACRIGARAATSRILKMPGAI